MTTHEDDPLPPGWACTTLAEVTVAEIDQSGPRKDADEFVYVDISSIDNRAKRIVQPKVLPLKQAPSRARQRLELGDVLVSMTRPNLNAVGLLPASLEGAIGSTGFHVLRAPSVVPEWLFYMVQTDAFVSAMSLLVQGALYPAVRPKDIRSYPIPIAPFAEQHRIVAEIEEQFTRLDAAVAGLERVQAKLKRYRAAVLKAACEGRLVPTEAEVARKEGREYEPADRLLEVVADQRGAGRTAAQLPLWSGKKRNDPEQMAALLAKARETELPEGWCWARVNEVGNVKLGRQRAPKHHHGPHMRPYLRVANVYEDRIDLTDVLKMNFSPQEYEQYRLELGDILLNEGQSLEWVGRPAMFRGEIEGACFQNTLVRFRASEAVDPRYPLIVFRAYLHDGTFRRIARWTVNIAHLGADRFANLVFPLPPLAEQQRIVAEVERRLSVIEEIEDDINANLKRAERMRQAVLKRAFEGKLVAQDPSDEPASALLERIRAERGSVALERLKVRRAGHEAAVSRSLVENRRTGQIGGENGDAALRTNDEG